MKKVQRLPNDGSRRLSPVFLFASIGILIILLIFSLYMELRNEIVGTEPNAGSVMVTPSMTATLTDSPLPTVTPTPEPTYTPTVPPTPTMQFGGSYVIGYSVNGLPIEVYQFGYGAKERMIVAGIHGGYEWNTVALADELIAYLTENPELVPPDVTLYILRNLNPDGYARAHDSAGRANANGVDLNRNFDADWLSDWNRDMCWHYEYVTAGSEPGSEPETQAFMAFVESHNLEALINYHSAGLGIFPGGNPPGPKSQLLAYYISMRSPYAYPAKDIGCVYSGQLVSWMVLQSVPAVDVELSTHGYTDFDINKGILEYFLRPDLGLDGS